jgi:hypothetical protein
MFNRPPQTVQRYLVGKATSRQVIRRFKHQGFWRCRREEPCASRRSPRPLCIETSMAGAPCAIPSTGDTTLGAHVGDLQTPDLRIVDRVDLHVRLARGGPMKEPIVVCVGRPVADFSDGRSIIPVRALDCVRDAVEDDVGSGVEQDEMASQETILDVVRKRG